MRQGTIYIDHINAFDNKKDSTCVISLIEAIVNCIRMILSDITRVISYQNSILPFFIHMLIISTGIFVSNFISKDTGYGKVLIDGHVVTIMKI